MRSPLLLLGMAALVSPLLAQSNVIKNGDFENKMTNWTAGGEGGSPGIVSADLKGLGTSNAFSIFPGGKVFNPPHKPYILKQSIVIIPKVEYEFSADVMSVATGNNAQGPLVEVKIGGVSVFKWQRFVGGIKTGTYREMIAGRFSQAKAGKVDIEIEIQRPKYIYNTRTPRFYIDNIKLAISPRPSVFIAGDRRIGGNLALRLQGTPGAAVGVFIAPKLFPTPLSIPGFKGRFELHLSSVGFLLAQALDAKTGLASVSLPVPNDKNLLGQSLYWEGVEVSTNPSIGPAHNLNLTN